MLRRLLLPLFLTLAFIGPVRAEVVRDVVRPVVGDVVRDVVAVNADYNIRTEGDSLMGGAYGISLQSALAALTPSKNLTNTAAGGSTMDELRDRTIDPDNAYLLPRTTIFWDGSHNGFTTLEEYVDFLEEAVNALGHQRFIVIPKLLPYGQTYAGSVTEDVVDEFMARWPNNTLDWRDWLANTDGSVAQSEFYDAPTDPFHLSQQGIDHMALGIWTFLRDKGWIANTASPIVADGSVWLFDPSLTEGAFAGTPSDATVLPNVAWEKAAALLGSGDATTLGTYITVNNVDGALTQERSDKLGLHAILDQDAMTAYTGNIQGVLVQPNAAIQTYLDGSVTDDWYFSVWYRPTRAPLSSGVNGANGAPQSLLHKALTASVYLTHTQNMGTPRPTSGGNLLGSLEDPEGSYSDNLDMPIIRAVGTTGYTGSQPPLQNDGLGHAGRGLRVAMGSWDVWASFNSGIAPSGILYRAYAENLTVSGRSYDTVEAMDQILFTGAFGEGGVFYDDSYTDPATLP